MKKLIAFLFVLMLYVPAASAETGVRYVDGASFDRVHLRTGPSLTAESLGLYYTGTPVQVFQQNGDWTFVVIGAAEGWMMSGYLTASDSAQLGPWQTVDNPHSTWVNLRAAPTTQGAILTCPDNGTAVHILGETADGWSYVDCDGVKGYMVTRYLSPRGDGADQRTVILGRTADWYYIHQYTAPNGQNICFTASEDEVDLTFQDVNFDGIEDIVVFTVMGAHNAFCEFFVYDAAIGEYVRAASSGVDDRLCNYQLYPEYGLVVTQTNYGCAGAMHEYCLYRWDGTDLKLIRSAVSEELTVTEYTTTTHTETTYLDILHITVRDHTLGGYDEAVIWEHTISLDDTETRDIFTEEMEALWQGIK